MMATASMLPESIDTTLRHRLRRSRRDPCYFNDHVLCRSPYWRAQREWAQALVEYRIVAVETGNGLGKGFLIGGLVPWFLWTREDSLVYICGAGQTQIGSVLFKEIRRAVQNSPFWNAGLLPMTISPGIKSSPATATIHPGWGALGFSTSTIERASGHHARHMLVIVDEASGVPDESWQAIDSLGFSKMLVAGNPIRPDGKFAELCDQGDRDLLEQRSPHLACRHFNVPSTASPHAHLDRSPWGMADRTWLEAMGRARQELTLVSFARGSGPSQVVARHAHSTPVAGARSQSRDSGRGLAEPRGCSLPPGRAWVATWGKVSARLKP